MIREMKFYSFGKKLSYLKDFEIKKKCNSLFECLDADSLCFRPTFCWLVPFVF